MLDNKNQDCIYINVLSNQNTIYEVQIPIDESSKEWIDSEEKRKAYIDNWVMANLRNVKEYEEPNSLSKLLCKLDVSKITDTTRIYLHIENIDGLYKVCLSVFYGASKDERPQTLISESITDENMRLLIDLSRKAQDVYPNISFINKCSFGIENIAHNHL